MFRHLAVGVDGSADADAALGLILELARRLGAVVHALHVVDTAVLEGSFLADLAGSMGVEPFVNLTPQVLEALERLAEALEERVRARAEEAGVELRWHAQRGFPARALLAMAQGCAPLALGKRGLNAAHHGEMLGPVTERLLRLADLPVLVAPPEVRVPERALLAY
ncbi:MAG: universal stress protein, partial [Nitrospirae bacterium]